MAALIMLNILGHKITTTVARGRYVTGTLDSANVLTLDASRTNKWGEACKRADAHGAIGIVHDTHTGDTFRSAKLAGIDTGR